MAKWLVKSEPSECSIGWLKGAKKTLWDGVRNYQARNFLRSMKRGDEVLFYHSNEPPVGVVGLVRVISEAEPDPTQFDPRSEYFDATSTRDSPRWWCPTLAFVREFPRVVSLAELRTDRRLSAMRLLQKGSRLSVHPVTDGEFRAIIELGEKR